MVICGDGFPFFLCLVRRYSVHFGHHTHTHTAFFFVVHAVLPSLLMRSLCELNPPELDNLGSIIEINV
jgi:hypothetical protein